MRVGLFGGSFDPPHLGHLAVARAAADRFELDEVLLAPTGRQPLKPDGACTSFADRLAMVELICNADSRLKASAIDAPRPDGEPNYTIDALATLRQEFPEPAELFVIVGADSFLELRRWRDPAALLAAAEWIVVSRPGFELGKMESLGLSKEQREKVHLLQDMSDPTSATAVRQRLLTGQDCSGVLGKALSQYIRERGLYSR